MLLLLLLAGLSLKVGGEHLDEEVLGARDVVDEVDD